MLSYVFIKKPGSAPKRLARVSVCGSFACRLRGLMFRRGISPQEGLLLVGSRDSKMDSTIHMLFVPFDLAVIWIDSQMTIVDKVLARRWRPFYAPTQPARFVLEIHPTLLAEYEVGQKVEFVNA